MLKLTYVEKDTHILLKVALIQKGLVNLSFLHGDRAASSPLNLNGLSHLE